MRRRFCMNGVTAGDCHCDTYKASIFLKKNGYDMCIVL